MRSRVRFPALPWRLFLAEEDSHSDHSLGSLVELMLRPFLVLHIHVSPSTSSGQRNCASWTSQHQTSVTLRPQPGGETTKSIRDMWWHWGKNNQSISCMWCCIMCPVENALVNKRRKNIRDKGVETKLSLRKYVGTGKAWVLLHFVTWCICVSP
jgi:hypothetical protein